ncbi:MAG: iron ABC transporter substrate-binding protein [Chloroflexi bacterium]|nr:iron ABC transporter substrate-binding protein [Chloroflexota bacterium]
MALAVAILALGLAACGGGESPTPSPQPQPTTTPIPVAPTATATPRPTPQPSQTITIYSGRNQVLVGAIIEQFTKDTGIKVQVRYGDTAQLAAAILEEGRNSPADVYWAQDAGALGAIAKKGVLVKLPDSILNKVDARFRSPKGEWVGVTGRARVVAYNTKKLSEQDLPDSIYGFTDSKWKGRIGWAPTNGSFQAFVTALRVVDGEAKARQWLEGIKANQPKAYRNNTTALLAVASGEADVAFINHYYLYAQLKEQGPSFPARNYYPRAGDAGAMINVAGVGILATSKKQEAALRFVEYMLSGKAQTYFASGESSDDPFEYPLIQGVNPHPDLPPLSQLKTPNIDLGNLDDLEGTLKLLRDLGIL